MSEIPGKKNKERMVVKVRFTGAPTCPKCFEHLTLYMEQNRMEIPFNLNSDFYIPLEWYEACHRIGCPHGQKPIIESVYSGQNS